MQEAPTVVFSPTQDGTLVLMRWGHNERLKAVLPSSHSCHRLAAPLLLEGLAHWFQRRLSVAVCVDSTLPSSELGLCNALGGGANTLHYQVEVLDVNRRGSRLHGIPGDFSRLRQLSLRRYP